MDTITVAGQTLVVRQAGPADAPAALAILVAADRWLQSRGLRQWGHYLSGEGEADLTAGVARGEVYLVLAGERPVGTISLQLGPTEWDRAVWSDVSSDDAVYVHRLAIDRVHAGQGLGAAMLDWAEEFGRRRARRYLRLDCVAENDDLNAYYARRFALVGQGANIGRRFSLYEKELLRWNICLIRRGDQLLLLNREKPSNMGLWNGPGGKLEPGETPLASVLREVREETGIQLDSARFAGTVTWEADRSRRGGMYLFVAEVPPELNYPTPRATPEGILDWKTINWILSPANHGVAEHLPRFLPTALAEMTPSDHHFTWEQDQLTGYCSRPLQR